MTYHGPGQLVAYPISRLAGARPAGPAARPRPRGGPRRDLRGARRRGRPARRPSRLLVRSGRPGPAQDRRARPAHRARRQLPRHRAQRDRRPRRLRPDRPVRDAGRHLDLDRARAAATTGATPTTASVEQRRGASSPRAFAAELGAPLDRDLTGGRRPLRAAQGPDHRLVGRDGRRPRLPPRPVRARRRAGRRPPVRLRQLLHARTATASASGCSRTSRSTSSAPTTTRASSTAASARSRSPRRARPAAGGRSSRRPASTGRSTRSATSMIEALVGGARDALAEARAAGQTDYLQVVQNWGAQAGARTNHLCLDLYDLPQVPHRIAEELGGAARFVIREGECPFCRLVRDESRRPDRLVWEDDASVAFAPYASRSPFEVWIVPRRHEADFGRATDAGRRRDRRGAPPGPRPARRQPRRAAVQPRPAHGAAARAGRRDLPLALGDPPAPARDRRPRARDRPAGQPGLARGRGRGAARRRGGQRGRPG